MTQDVGSESLAIHIDLESDPRLDVKWSRVDAEATIDQCDVGFQSVFGAWCAVVPFMGLLISLGILYPWTSTYQLQGYSESSIGWIYGAYGFFLYLDGSQDGRHDCTELLLVAALICFSFSEEYYHIFLAFSVLGGLSVCTLFTLAVFCVGHRLNIRYGYTTGIAYTAGGLGSVIFPLITLFAAPKIGFTWAIRTIALLCAVLWTLACLLLKSRPPSNKKAGASNIKHASTTEAVFVEFAVLIPITYISSYAVHISLSNTFFYALIVFLNLGAVPGRFLSGFVADRLGRLWLNAWGNVAAIFCYAALFGFWR
ncbi:major facilitator superfamily domain-containing protein [Aspergillus alliaceus]|uniref:major facilitator superfamily domain-containing protein n=1 Tax=Petromyces alliaceus TaxID=209559 RepID=UPI0012A3EFAE|nr:major facilitator superfamily domain-containing protein [Aspergillus alliaceus]KAB8235296.1 major facilitator superfamily domain-containing protein [Aspergillus alliaceus]